MLKFSYKIKLFSLILLLSAVSWACQKEDPQPSTGIPNNNSYTPPVGDTTLYDLQITINGFENTNGQIVLALFNSEDGFANDDPIVGRIEPLTATSHLIFVENLPTGYYGISCFHDEDQDGELGTNSLGIPKEGFGFSTNPTVTFSAPGWSDIRFLLNAQDSTQSIKLKY